MTRAAPPQFSLNSGEIAPTLLGRPDFIRYQSGLRRCRGFMPIAEGIVTRLPGTRHAGTTRNNHYARLEPFIFAQDDAHVLEFTGKIMRVWRNGALVLKDGVPFEMVTPWPAIDLPLLRFAQSASRIYVVDGKTPPQRISRLALDDWTIEPVPFEKGPFLSANTDEALTVQASATTGTVTITASAALFEAGHVDAFWRIEPANEDDVPYWTGNEGVSVGDQMRYDGAVYEIVGFGVAGGGGTPPTSGNTGPNPPIHKSGRWLSSKDGPRWEYKYGDAGVVKITAVTSDTVATGEVVVELPAGAVSEPTSFWSEGAWSALRGYPATLAFHEQRLVLAATETDPQTVWFSAVGDFVGFEPSLEADGSFSYAIASQQNRINRIVWIVSGGRTLHIGTAGAEYSARSSSTDVVIGPTNAVFRPDTSEGSAAVPPLTIDGSPVFVARGGSRIHELAYDFGADRVDAPEITRAGRHLFDGIIEMSWQTTPWRSIWAVLENARLSLLAYDKRQEQVGAGQSTCGGGDVESIAIVPTPDGTDEQIYMAIRRGAQQVHVEISQPAFVLSGEEADILDAWHLWDALDYDGPPVTELPGLDHLDGRANVHAWTDQGSLGPLTVTGGTVTFPVPVSRAIIGLDDLSDHLKTLHQTAGAADGGSQGRQSRVKAHGLRFLATSNATIETETVNGRSVNTSKPRRVIPAPDNVFGPPQRFDGVVDVPAAGGWGVETTHTLRPEPGGPMTLASYTPILQMGDG